MADRHEIDLSGDYETTIYDVVRRLLAESANPSDTVETWRGGKLSMSGVAGWLAKRHVVFRSSGPCLARYGARTLAPLAALGGEPATMGP